MSNKSSSNLMSLESEAPRIDLDDSFTRAVVEAVQGVTEEAADSIEKVAATAAQSVDAAVDAVKQVVASKEVAAVKQAAVTVREAITTLPASEAKDAVLAVADKALKLSEDLQTDLSGATASVKKCLPQLSAACLPFFRKRPILSVRSPSS